MHTQWPCLAVNALPSELEDGTVCNSGDVLAEHVIEGSKLVWHVRHGQSTGNVAKEIARAADNGTGENLHEIQYQAETAYIDAPLTDLGLSQAEKAREYVASWHEKPQLIVCSPLTRAIQTAAVMFKDVLGDGHARMVIRPELREFWANNNENMGRTLAELNACPHLQALLQLPTVQFALSSDATADWKEQWDTHHARGDGSWQEHVTDVTRLLASRVWLGRQPETKIAVVSHWGTINNSLNREPWARNMKKQRVPAAWNSKSWPQDGLAKIFNMTNCGWIAVTMTPSMQSEAIADES